jgi:hypothetical protein
VDGGTTAAREAPPVLGLVLAAIAVLCLVLALSSDPGSGTATNLQPVGDAAGLVIGAHHAKPLPLSGSAVVGLVLLGIAAIVRLVLVDRRGAVTSVVPRPARSARLPRPRWVATCHARRAPPSMHAA